ncbi:MAG: hypothetical protein GW939_02630, partial [Candidatus Magasanikbacteria bacterium]|nr:hypothetical protein [Candidatus Magasanikbacteria bacterium]
KKENTSNTPPNDIKTIDDIENEISSTKACEQTVAPVCGLDGFTYTNQCIAESQRVQINHDGACKDVQQLLDADIPSPPPKTDTTATNTSNTKTDVIASGKPLDLSWLEHVKRFAKKEQSIIPVTIQECRIGGKYLYYKTGDFSVLYDHESELVCFPNNDLGDFCPSYFTKDNIIKGCTTIWQK